MQVVPGPELVINRIMNIRDREMYTSTERATGWTACANEILKMVGDCFTVKDDEDE